MKLILLLSRLLLKPANRIASALERLADSADRYLAHQGIPSAAELEEMNAASTSTALPSTPPRSEEELADAEWIEMHERG